MNNKFPLNYIVFSSTRGHFDIKTRYLETISNLNNKFPLTNFSANYVHIATSPNENDLFLKMKSSLESLYNINVISTEISWQHDNQSHQIGYLSSMWNIYNRDDVNAIEYSLVSEDDFFIKTYSKDLEYYLNKAISILKDNSNIMQIRIPRFTNEFERINKLKEKHNIDAKAIKCPEDDEIFHQNDWSNNVFVSRTRDLRNALLLMLKNQQSFPMHSEHGLSMAMKSFSLSEVPFMCFEPLLIRCGHIGCPLGQEDNLDKPLISD